MKLVFVYNADSRLRNGVKSLARKTLTRKADTCKLTEVTITPLGMHRETRDLKWVKSYFVQPVGYFEGTLKISGQTHAVSMNRCRRVGKLEGAAPSAPVRSRTTEQGRKTKDEGGSCVLGPWSLVLGLSSFVLGPSS